MQFGEQIRGLRKRRSMSQERFAQELHVTRQAVSNWENTRTSPTWRP
jgi:transcriptional regulator with XRE-family HTH domain